MKENVGRIDQTGRFIIGPTLAALGYAWFGGNRGKLTGLAAMIVGTLITESAITRVCPVSRLFGIDTRTQRERDRDLQDLLQLHERRVPDVAPRFRADADELITPVENITA